MEIGFDIISDLNLSPDDSFNWENKATSLYCIIAGNVSTDPRTTLQTLAHLSNFYQGIFYTLSRTDYNISVDYSLRTEQLINAYNRINKVAVLHHHVVLLDGIAILGVNGWENSESHLANRLDDLAYLSKSIGKLQRHLDVKKIIVVSNAVPNNTLYFGEHKNPDDPALDLDYCLEKDTEKKVSHWVYGSYNKTVDTVINGVNFINNGYFKRKPYYPKRISLQY